MAGDRRRPPEVFKSAGAWLWNSTDRFAAGKWIENIGYFGQDWAYSAGMHA